MAAVEAWGGRAAAAAAAAGAGAGGAWHLIIGVTPG